MIQRSIIPPAFQQPAFSFQIIEEAVNEKLTHYLESNFKSGIKCRVNTEASLGFGLRENQNLKRSFSFLDNRSVIRVGPDLSSALDINYLDVLFSSLQPFNSSTSQNKLFNFFLRSIELFLAGAKQTKHRKVLVFDCQQT